MPATTSLHVSYLPPVDQLWIIDEGQKIDPHLPVRSGFDHLGPEPDPLARTKRPKGSRHRTRGLKTLFLSAADEKATDAAIDAAGCHFATLSSRSIGFSFVRELEIGS
jgi:hypothetical protein